MTASNTDLARAVLEIGATGITDARATVRTYETALHAFGEKTARWTVANNRDETDAGRVIDLWSRSDGAPTLVVASVPGTGKTVECARWCGLAGGQALRASDVDRWPWGGGDRHDRALRLPALFIDDLGRESDKGQGRGLITEIICTRHDGGRPTLVASMISSVRAKEERTYPDHMLDRVGKNWINLRKQTSRRGKDINPDMVGLDRARLIVRGAMSVESIAARVRTDDSGSAQDLAGVLGLDPDLIAVRLAEFDADAERLDELISEWNRSNEVTS